MPDFFSTSGNQIVNSLGQPVKLTGVSWFGLETPNFAPDGLHVRNYKDMIDQMAGLGFNTLRIPYSSAALEPERTPPAGTIDVYNANKELAGLTSLEILDKIIAYAGTKGLRVVLDHHRSTVGYSAQESGVWYTAEYPESRWISDWVMLAERYKDVDTVIGADLHNEPYGATWSQWASAAETAANTIHAVNPNWLMFVEGVAQHENTYYWWGGNLQGVRTRPIQLNTPNKVVYSPHDYPDSVFSQPWFQGENWETNLTNVFRQNWGFIYEEGMAPVFLGEWGSRLQETKDQTWFSKLLSYLGGDFNADGANDLAPEQLGISWSWWAWNPNSGDTGGLLTDGWMTIDRGKYIALQPIISGVLLPTIPDTGGTTGGGDTLPGTPEPDAPSAGSGNDSYVVNDAATLIVENQGSGLDTVRTSINYALPQNVERLEALDPAGLTALLLIGNALSNEIIGNAGPNWIDGRGGVDTMIGLGGNDTYVVDHGADWVSEFAGGGTDTVLTSVSYALGGNSHIEILTAVRWDVIVLALTGNDFANKIRGNEGSNVLKGRGGNDVLSAYGGNDRLYGGLGADTLYGGAGKDAFFFDTSPARTGNVDRIADFNIRDDVIRVDNAVFRKAGPNGRLDGDAFTRGSAATDAEDRFIYNPLTGSLFYDADGTGPANALKLAILKKGLLLTAADFAII